MSLPTFMISALLYNVFLPVWCLPACMMCAYLYNVCSTVLCPPTWMMSTEIVQKNFSTYFQSFPNLLSRPSLSTSLHNDSKIFMHFFLFCETNEIWINNGPFHNFYFYFANLFCVKTEPLFPHPSHVFCFASLYATKFHMFCFAKRHETNFGSFLFCQTFKFRDIPSV